MGPCRRVEAVEDPFGSERLEWLAQHVDVATSRVPRSSGADVLASTVLPRPGDHPGAADPADPAEPAVDEAGQPIATRGVTRRKGALRPYWLPPPATTMGACHKERLSSFPRTSAIRSWAVRVSVGSCS